MPARAWAEEGRRVTAEAAEILPLSHKYYRARPCNHGKVGAVVEAAWRAGARLDAWREYFKPELWDAAVAECGIDREKIAHTAYSLDAELPWDHIRFYNDKEKLKK